MEPVKSDLAPIRSALFVDFDNIFIGLSKTDPQAAERFASDPARWLSWLERGLPVHSGIKGEMPQQRSILIRRCYPNPDAGFRRFRSFYTSAAFSVIDCPSMTRTGKNSSDIYMVMDILDTLEHKTYFDEFIIFSGDSDFMPVLLRLRAHDRRTTTLAIDFMPPAYKAACDLVISEEDFIEDALGVTHEGGSIRARASLNLLKEMAMRLYEAACQTGEVDGADLPDILKDFREFRDSNNWLGFGLSQRLAEALVAAEPRLHLIRLSTTMYKLVIKPQVVKAGASAGKERGERAALEREAPERGGKAPAEKQQDRSHAAEKPAKAAQSRGDKDSASEKLTKVDVAQLRTQILDVVKEVVAAAPAPVLLARISQQIVTRLGPQVLETQWAGAGSFKKLLQGAADQGLEVTTQPEPGYVFDPRRHVHPGLQAQGAASQPATAPEAQPTVPAEASLPAAEPATQAGEAAPPEVELETPPDDGVPYTPENEPPAYHEMVEEDEEAEEEAYNDEAPPTLEEFIRRVSRVTGAPDLTSEQYALVFRGMVLELKQIAAGEKSYTTYQSSKAVSEWCADHGHTVSRSDIVLIFKGIIFQDGVRFGKQPGSYTARELAEVVCSNIRALCRRSQLDLSAYEEHLLEEWIIGAVDDEDAQEIEELTARRPPAEEETYVEEPPQGAAWAEQSHAESAWTSVYAGEPDPGLQPDEAAPAPQEEPPASEETPPAENPGEETDEPSEPAKPRRRRK